MTPFILFAIILGIISIGFIVIFKITDNEMYVLGIVFGIIISVIMAILAIVQPISIKKELKRQDLERTQIIYQIERFNNGQATDPIKLNEWILTYNDWVNDINSNKEIYGWWSWYHNVDMTNHTYIDLV